MTKLQVFDPPMCCSTGACGPNVDRKLVVFASDLHWLRQQGVEVERFNLSSNPAAFVEHEAVKKAMEEEGNDCLPIILVDGSIVSKGIYPSRSDLMKHTGIESSSSAKSANKTSACGPGCDCNVPSGGRTMKMIISLIVLLAVSTIIFYKTSSANEVALNNSPTQDGAGYSAAGLATGKDATENETPVEEALPTRVGEHLNSMNDLNTVAMNQTAVFIYIPERSNGPVPSSTIDSVLAAQRTLQSNNITIGLYTLATNSSDYTSISTQVQAPAILVLSKGKGSAVVTGDVTETKLIQAFTSSNRSGGGCCPSGGGSSGGKPGC